MRNTGGDQAVPPSYPTIPIKFTTSPVDMTFAGQMEQIIRPAYEMTNVTQLTPSNEDRVASRDITK